MVEVVEVARTWLRREVKTAPVRGDNVAKLAADVISALCTEQGATEELVRQGSR